MTLTVRDEVARYRIEASDASEVRQDDKGNDYLIVPDPDGQPTPFWLFDEVLIEAARSGEFGLRLIAEDPLK